MALTVSVVIPTRGNVDLTEIVTSFPPEWEVLIYDNGLGVIRTYKGAKWGVVADELPDLAVYARYETIKYASNDLILSQDDDCVLPPKVFEALLFNHKQGELVANMSQYHQLHHSDAPLLGFGSLFERNLPGIAFAHWGDTSSDLFLRTCDVVFAALTPSCCVDVPFRYLPWSSTPERMSKQGGFAVERQDVLDKAKVLRAA